MARPASAVSSSSAAAGNPKFQLIYPRPLGLSNPASTPTGAAPAIEAGADSSLESSESASSGRVSSAAVNPETAAEQKALCGEQASGQPHSPNSVPLGSLLPGPQAEPAARENSGNVQPPPASRRKLRQQTVGAYLVADPEEEGILAHREGEAVGTLSAVQSDPVGSCRSYPAAAPKALGRSDTGGDIPASSSCMLKVISLRHELAALPHMPRFSPLVQISVCWTAGPTLPCLLAAATIQSRLIV